MRHRKRSPFRILADILHPVIVVLGAAAFTLLCFLVLPLIQTLNKPPTADLMLQNMDVAQLEPPPPPPEEEEPEEEEQEEEPPPELMEEAPPLDLSQLELALNPGVSGGFLQGDFTVNLVSMASGGKDVEELFSLADLDQKPRVIYQPGPRVTPEVRKYAPGTVYLIFIVNRDGRVENPIVQKSSNPVFEKPALDTIRKWKFDPGKRNGQAVRFRMRVPFTFPEGL